MPAGGLPAPRLLPRPNCPMWTWLFEKDRSRAARRKPRTSPKIPTRPRVMPWHLPCTHVGSGLSSHGSGVPVQLHGSERGAVDQLDGLAQEGSKHDYPGRIDERYSAEMQGELITLGKSLLASRL